MKQIGILFLFLCYHRETLSCHRHHCQRQPWAFLWIVLSRKNKDDLSFDLWICRMSYFFWNFIGEFRIHLLSLFSILTIFLDWDFLSFYWHGSVRTPETWASGMSCPPKPNHHCTAVNRSQDYYRLPSIIAAHDFDRKCMYGAVGDVILTVKMTPSIQFQVFYQPFQGFQNNRRWQANKNELEEGGLLPWCFVLL